MKWIEWLKKLDNFFLTSGLEDSRGKKALLLQLVDSEVSKVYEKLLKEENEIDPDYERTKELLTDYFNQESFNRLSLDYEAKGKLADESELSSTSHSSPPPYSVNLSTENSDIQWQICRMAERTFKDVKKRIELYEDSKEKLLSQRRIIGRKGNFRSEFLEISSASEVDFPDNEEIIITIGSCLKFFSDRISIHCSPTYLLKVLASKRILEEEKLSRIAVGNLIFQIKINK